MLWAVACIVCWALRVGVLGAVLVEVARQRRAFLLYRFDEATHAVAALFEEHAVRYDALVLPYLLDPLVAALAPVNDLLGLGARVRAGLAAVQGVAAAVWAPPRAPPARARGLAATLPGERSGPGVGAAPEEIG